jgi:NACHT domain
MHVSKFARLFGSLLVVSSSAIAAWAFTAESDRSLAVWGVWLALVPLALAALGQVWRYGRTDVVNTDIVSQTADSLAAHVRQQWEDAAADQGLRHPAPARVPWRRKKFDDAAPRRGRHSRGHSGPAHEATSHSTAARALPLPGMERVPLCEVRAGDLPDLFRIYAGLDSGRIVIIGPAGSGKSSAAILLILDALAHRAGLNEQDRVRAPVPIMLPVSGWDPQRQRLRDWLSTQIEREYRVRRELALRLVIEGRIALIVDDLDELPDEARARVIRALSDQASFRLIVLSRGDELEATAQANRFVADAAVVALEPVSAHEAADYLARCRTQPHHTWTQLVTQVRTGGDLAGRALRTPLMLSLVRDAFPQSGDVSELLSRTRFRSQDELADYLIDRIIPVAYAHRDGVPEPEPPYTAEQAQHWLGFQAAALNTYFESRDLAWWRMYRFAAGIERFAMSLLAVWIASGLLIGAVFGIRYGLLTAITVGTEFGAFVGLYAGVMAATGGRLPKRMGRIRWRQLLIQHFTLGLSIGPLIGIAVAISTTPSIGAAVFVAIWLTGWLGLSISDQMMWPTTGSDSPLNPGLSWRRDWQSTLVDGAILALAFGSAGWLFLRSVDRDPTFCVVSASTGLAAALASSPTWQSCLGFVQIRKARRGPLRMIRFLEDARRRHILRSFGSAYQFRHARLQDRIADEFARSLIDGGRAMHPAASTRRGSNEPTSGAESQKTI